MNLFLNRWLVLCLVLVSLGAQAQVNLEAGLIELVEKMDASNAAMQTMRARFIQRREISLLKEPVEKRGMVYLKKDAGIKFEFEAEEDLIVIITEEEMAVLSPQAKEADLLPIKKQNFDLTQTILSDTLKDLPDYFKITRARGLDEDNPYQRLILHPTKRKLRKKFKELEVRVNADHLITHTRVVSKDGDVFELIFEDIEVNPELDTAMFDTSIPEGYRMADRMETIFGPGVDFR